MALLLVLFIAFFVVVFLFLLPILFSLQAMGSLFIYPKQLRAIFGNKILRRNHALEHATIVVMMEREPGRKLNGFSTDDGFFVQGVRSISEVESAAREAMRRLQNGEKRLAIHRNCGTTIVAANLLAAIVILTLYFAHGTPVVDISSQVESVNSGTPAAAAGLHSGDRIVAVDGSRVEPADVRPAVERALASGGPSLVHVRVDRDLAVAGPDKTGWWDVPVPEGRPVYDEQLDGRAEEQHR